jgi:hypothetical protein
MSISETLQKQERSELVKRLYLLADMADRGKSAREMKAAAEFIAHSIQTGWDWDWEMEADLKARHAKCS